MKKINCLLILPIFFTGLFNIHAQSNIVFTMIVGDTAVLSVSGHNGSVQWQKSPDSLKWTDISGATNNPQTIITDTSYTGKCFYRAKIDSLCYLSPAYSTVIRHKILTNINQVQLGNWFRGGIVFYNSGGIGLIAAPYDQSEVCDWGCYGTAVGSGSQDTSNGAANTAAIVAFHDGLNNYYGNPTQCNTNNNGTVAAKICDTLTLNGYNDWFLPAKDQLMKLYLNSSYVGGFTIYTYWSSTEFNANTAWGLYFMHGKLYCYDKYSWFYNNTRCIKSF